MNATPLAAFDSIAASYDERWTYTGAGMLQRKAVWRQLDPIIQPGDRVLDLGCGTGEDALHFTKRDASVLAVDASSEMVAHARAKGVNAHVLRVEELARLGGTRDLVLSNFGVLNCVRNLAGLREPLACILRPNGFLAICLMGRFCLWEFCYYALRGQFRKAARRWSGATNASRGLRIYYPRVRQVCDALSPRFELCSDTGIGICVPPSFVPALPGGLLNTFGRIDQHIAANKIARITADHRLLVFRRL